MGSEPFSFTQFLAEPLEPAILAESAEIQLARDLARLDEAQKWKLQREKEIVSTVELSCSRNEVESARLDELQSDRRSRPRR